MALFLKENIILLFCEIMSSFCNILIIKKFLLFNIYRWEVGCYTLRELTHASYKTCVS